MRKAEGGTAMTEQALKPLCFFCHALLYGPILVIGDQMGHVRCAVLALRQLLDPDWDALVDAAGSRLEPILLTSMAAIVGLMPITLSDPLWRGLGGAIISGLIFSGAIKLFFVPVVYYEWFKEKAKIKQKV